MKVDAKKTKDGFLIPMTPGFKKIRRKKIQLDIKIVKRVKKINDYSSLDQLIGLCETGRMDASIDHDRVVYFEKTK